MLISGLQRCWVLNRTRFIIYRDIILRRCRLSKSYLAHFSENFDWKVCGKHWMFYSAYHSTLWYWRSSYLKYLFRVYIKLSFIVLFNFVIGIHNEVKSTCAYCSWFPLKTCWNSDIKTIVCHFYDRQSVKFKHETLLLATVVELWNVLLRLVHVSSNDNNTNLKLFWY